MHLLSCGTQSPRWLPMIPASWNSHSCVVPSHNVPELVCVGNSIQQKWWYFTSEIWLSEDYGFCLRLSLSCWLHFLLWETLNTVLWKHDLGKEWDFHSTDHGELKSTEKTCWEAWKQILQPPLSLMRDSEPAKSLG